jgi:DNA polymerase-4
VGAHLHDLAWGRDPRPVTPERQEKSIGAETTFEVDTADLTVVSAHLLGLADRCAAGLRGRGLVARTISIKVRTADFRTLTRSRTIGVPTDVAREIYLTARELLGGTDLGGQPVRLIGVRAEGLTEAAVRQVTLEEAVADDSGARRRAEQAMDEVRHRFGSRAVRHAATISEGATTPTTARATGDLS